MGFRIKTSERACSAVQVSCGGDQIDVYVGTSDAKLIALANGYVKLADDEIVMPRKVLERMIREQCVSCHFDETEVPNCADCEIKPIRDRIKEARDERD